MKTAADVILALEATSGRLDKEAIVREAWQLGILDFFKGARLAYDALVTFGVKQVALIESGEDELTGSLSWEKFEVLASALSSRPRQLSGHAARAAIDAASDECSIREWNGFYRRVLLKDFKCGVTDGTINRVLEAIVDGGDSAAEPYIIPVFQPQLAKPAEENQRHMKGEKLLDIKLDGVRLISHIDVELNEVTQYTREGRINTNFPHIADMLAKLIPHLKESMAFDGEITSRAFQELMSQLNRSKGKANTMDAKLALFDLVPWKDFVAKEYSVDQTTRHEALVQFMPLLQQVSQGAIYVVPKLSVNLDTPEGQATFKEFNKETVDAGYEGIMIKDPKAPYRCTRGVAWMKIKPKITVDLTVIGFEQGKPDGKFAHTLGGVICEGKEGDKEILVTVGGGFSEDLREWIWNNKDKVLGLIMEVEADAITKPKKGTKHGLRFPVYARFRGFEPGEKL